MGGKRLILLIFTCLLLDSSACYSSSFPGKNWEKASSSQLKSWSAEILKESHSFWNSLKAAGLMIIEKGRVIASWGDVSTPVECHSVRKSFMSALIGIGVEERKIDLLEPLYKVPLDDLPTKLNNVEKKAKVIDLLKSRSGIYLPAAYEKKAMSRNRPARGQYQPGKFWYYNNWDFNALGSIFRTKTGEDIFESFFNKIASPIGMEDFTISLNKYHYGKKRSSHPAYTFKMSTRDRARFGLLFLNGGRWKDEQVISKSWVVESTQSYSDTGKGVGYGYMWWVSVKGRHLGSSFKGVPFSARGSHGQYIIVIPEMDLVIAHSVDNKVTSLKRSTFNKLLKMILSSRKG